MHCIMPISEGYGNFDCLVDWDWTYPMVRYNHTQKLQQNIDQENKIM